MGPTSVQVMIVNDRGLHLRAASLFVQTARQYRAQVRVARDERAIDGKSILDLATLMAGCGTKLQIEADGPDAENAVLALSALVNAGFFEVDGDL
jgi:phosphocarrier protein